MDSGADGGKKNKTKNRQDAGVYINFHSGRMREGRLGPSTKQTSAYGEGNERRRRGSKRRLVCIAGCSR